METAADNATAANTLYNVNGHFGRRRHPIVTPECGGSPNATHTFAQQTRQALRITHFYAFYAFYAYAVR